MNNQFTRFTNFSIGIIIVLALASCYKFGRIGIVTEVAGNAPFDCRITAINDGNDGPQTGLSFFAVRVPEQWNVVVDGKSYVQYAKEGTLDADRNPVNMTAAMRYNYVLAEMLNQSNPKEGYTWFAFQTKECIRRSIAGSAAGGADSICIDFKVINNGVAGTYDLDFTLGSYETTNPNVMEEELVGRLDDVEGSDIYRVSTEQVVNGKGAFNTVDASFKRSVTVLEGGVAVDNSPQMTVRQSGNNAEIEYANMSGKIEVFKNASTVGIDKDHIIVGDQKYNTGSYSIDVSDLEPGVYHVRNVASGAEDTFTIAEREFMPRGTTMMVIGSTGMLAPENLVSAGVKFETDRIGNANLYEMSQTVIQAMIDSVLAVKPRLLLISGDLTMNGDAASHQTMADMLAPIIAEGIKVYVVPGDRDINNPYACIYEGDTATPVGNITASDFADKYYADYGYRDAVSRDENTLSYMAYPTDKLAILALDACQYANNGVKEVTADDGTVRNDTILDASGVLENATLEWMTKVITEAHASGRQVIAMAHHQLGAPFDGYQTLGNIINNDEKIDLAAAFAASQTGSTDNGETMPVQTSTSDIVNSYTLQSLLAANGVDAVFVGDGGATDIACLKTMGDVDLYQVATGSAIAYGCPFRIVDVTDEGMEITTRLIKNIPMEGTTFEDYAYYRTKNMLYTLVNEYVKANWDTIDAMLKERFTFEYNEGDLIDKNAFMNLPKTPEQAAQNVNNTIIPPLVDVILAFVDGNENKKKSDELIEGMLKGVDGLISTINNSPAIVNPIIKEGFASAGLDIDVMTYTVVSSIAHDYVGEESNVVNDLYLNIPFANYDPTSISTANAGAATGKSSIYTVCGVKVENENPRGVYIERRYDGTVRKVVKK